MQKPFAEIPIREESANAELVSVLNAQYGLVVWNDNVNTFDWVIKSLVEICGHNNEQAEQCALLIHHQGKYAVKKGDFEFLKPQCDAIRERNIGATIEKIS